MLRRAMPLALLLAVAWPDPGRSEDREGFDDAAAAAERLFTARRLEPEWFTPRFVDEIPMAALENIVASLRDDFGGFVEVRGDAGELTVRLERADVPVQLTLERDGRIAGLFLGTPAPVRGEPGAIVEQLAALAETASVLVDDGAGVRIALQPDRPLSVASTFKLVVLKAYEDRVAEGSVARGDVVAFRPSWRSLPLGVLQDWPEETPLTLETLAGLMVSISDNTAADALIDLLGRDAMEAIAPRTTPFPTTREVFLLKRRGAGDRRARYAAADIRDRRRMLARFADLELGDAADMESQPTPKVGWFFTVRELCRLIAATFEAPAVAINPGPVEAADWRRVAFKGGSDAGVLNLTAMAEREDGSRVCASITLNSASTVDETRAALLFGSLFKTLR